MLRHEWTVLNVVVWVQDKEDDISQTAELICPEVKKEEVGN